MLEIRWAPGLQYRLAVAVDAGGAFCPGPPGEWRAVPLVPDEPPSEPDLAQLVRETIEHGIGLSLIYKGMPPADLVATVTDERVAMFRALKTPNLQDEWRR